MPVKPKSASIRASKAVVPLSRTPGFWFLMGAQVSEQIADSLNLMALWAVFRAVFKGDSSMVSLCLFLPMVPAVLLLGPLAGVFVDRTSKRKLLIGAALGRGILVGIMALLAPSTVAGSHASLGLLVAVIFLVSCIWQFYGPARSAALPEVVPPEHLDVANSVSVTVLMVMQIIGLLVGGLMGDNFRPSLVLWINAACYGVTTGFLLLVRFHKPVRHVFDRLSYRSIQKELLVSLRKLFSPSLHVRGAVLSVVMLVLVVGLAFPNLESFTSGLKFPPSMDALDTLLLSSWGLTVGPLTRFTLLLLTATAGAGIGIASLGWLRRRFSQLVVIQASLLVCGVFFFLLPRLGSETFLAAAMLMAGTGLGGTLVIALTEARIQKKIPGHLRGKVLAAYFMARGGVVLIGAVVPGTYEKLFKPLSSQTWLKSCGWLILAFAVASTVWHLQRHGGDQRAGD